VNPTLLGCALGWLGSMPLAGPVSALVVKRGLSGHARHGFALAAGAALAETGWCAGALLGYGALFDRWYWLRPAAGAVGGALVLVFGLRLLLGRRGEAPPPHLPPAPRRGWFGEIVLGFSLVVVNPGVLLSWAGVLAALHAVGLEPASQQTRLQFAAGVPAGIVAWFALLLWLLRHAGSRLGRTLLPRALRLLGALLCAAGLWALTVATRRLTG
jgi:threonine/homoserine/homoserine lactone efflux protein